MIDPQLSGQALTSRISNCRVFMQEEIDVDAGLAQIVKGAEEVGNEFGIVGDVFKAADGLELARQVIGDLANRGVGIEGAIPGPSIVVIETIATRARMRECSVDERKAGPTKYELARIELRKPCLLRGQAAVCSVLERG
ncbi:hypothetical protein LMTR13_10525 [Bradyrhizobium icense]|uniref:Uncharacterized protein n=1 Tax=Bradyrhizobium icense TaxID=1274631 RepID=A0A1B1UCQ4_9BRAD|nr:hypothetical protein LMTR13_10525 [Bradyrhizobium icense]